MELYADKYISWLIGSMPKNDVYLSKKSYAYFMKKLAAELNIDSEIVYEQDWSGYEVITFRNAVAAEFNNVILCVPPKIKYRIHINSGDKILAGALMYMYINNDVQSVSLDQFIYKIVYYGMVFVNYYKAEKMKVKIQKLIKIMLDNFVKTLTAYDIDIKQLRDYWYTEKRKMNQMIIDILVKNSMDNGCPKICTKGRCDEKVKRSESHKGIRNAAKDLTEEEYFFIIDSPFSSRKTVELFQLVYKKRISIGRVLEIIKTDQIKAQRFQNFKL